MLGAPMTPRLIALALALVLLVTQQLGLQHLLSHGLQAAGLAADTAHATAHATTPDATPDAAADGLCQACLALVVLGTATLPALLRWATRVQRAVAPAAPVRRAMRRGAAAPYLARAPPQRA
jgi:hypothetical protein